MQQRARAKAKKTAAAQREITDAYDKQKKALGELVNTYRTNNELALKRLKFENDLIGKSDDVVEVERAKQQVLENQRSCTNDLIAKEKEILGIIGSIETEMANNHNSLIRVERNAPRVNRMQKSANPNDTVRLAYSIIEEPEVITEVSTDNSKSLEAVRKLKNKISSDIKKNQ